MCKILYILTVSVGHNYSFVDFSGPIHNQYYKWQDHRQVDLHLASSPLVEKIVWGLRLTSTGEAQALRAGARVSVPQLGYAILASSPGSLLNNGGKREPGNIHKKCCRLSARHHSCDQRRTFPL